MLGLHDIQYLYEFLFWVFIYISLRLVWHLPNVRFGYGIAVAIFNLAAIVMYTISSLAGQIGPLDAFAFAFQFLFFPSNLSYGFPTFPLLLQIALQQVRSLIRKRGTTNSELA